MKKHKDLIAVLKSNNMRITPARRLLIQFILDHKTRRIPLRKIHDFVGARLKGVNRSSIYRNLETFKKLDILQELNFPDTGKQFQYVFDKKVHHFYICKACGKSSRGNEELFQKIESALEGIRGFSKANLSAIFYGYCSKCSAKS